MAGFADLQKRGRSLAVNGLLIGLGVVVGYALPQNSVSPTSDTGIVTSAAAGGGGITFSFTPKSGPKETLRYLGSTPWQAKPSGRWSTSGMPSCLLPSVVAASVTKPSGKPAAGRSRSATASPGASSPATGPADRVTIGVVNVTSVGSAPGGHVIAWVECYG